MQHIIHRSAYNETDRYEEGNNRAGKQYDGSNPIRRGFPYQEDREEGKEEESGANGEEQEGTATTQDGH